MKALIIFCCAFFQERTIEEKIEVLLPEFYSGWFTNNNYREIGVVLSPPPPGVSRRYFLRIVGQYGKVSDEVKEIGDQEFYARAYSILGYGVLDSARFDPEVNEGFKNFVNLLLNKKILSREQFAQYVGHYAKKSWLESAYMAEEVLPGIVPASCWIKHWENNKDSVHSSDPTATYFLTMALIKMARDSKEIEKWFTQRFSLVADIKDDKDNGKLFFDFVKTISVLAKAGVQIPDSVQEAMLHSYARYDAELTRGLIGVYRWAKLPLPPESMIQKGLTEVVEKAERPLPHLVREFRLLGLIFPADKAEFYRDVLIKSEGDLADIDYLVKLVGRDADPKLWKRYGDWALWRHEKCKENRKTQSDSEDYYHLAVVAYKRASNQDSELVGMATIDRLLKSEEDLSVRTLDLIAVHEMAGHDPKMKEIVAILDKRIEALKKLPSGALYNGFWKIAWVTNEFGQRLLPFRDEIELAFYLKDPERTRALSREMADYFLQRVASEGQVLKAKFENEFSKLKALILAEAPDSIEMLEGFYFGRALENLDTPTFVELTAILDHYEALGFEDGARSLAQYLREQAGLNFHKRRAFRIGDFEKFAEEQVYSKFPQSYWDREDRIYVASVRKSAISKAQNK